MATKIPRSIWVGALWMVGASLGISILVALVKIASPYIPTLEIVWFQSVIGVLLMAPVVAKRGLRPKHPWWQFIGGTAGCLGYVFFFLGVRYASMVNVVLATNTAPLWVPLICLVVMRERLRWLTWLGIVAGFIGIAIILQPWLQGFHPAVGFGLITGLLLGILLVAMRSMAHRDGPYLILFYYSLISTVLTTPFAIAQWTTPTGWIWWVLLGTGLMNGFLQLARVWSFQRGPASIMSPIYFLAAPFTGIIGWIFWDEIPHGWFYLGAAFVIGGGIWTIVTGSRAARR